MGQAGEDPSHRLRRGSGDPCRMEDLFRKEDGGDQSAVGRGSPISVRTGDRLDGVQAVRQV